MTGLVGIRGLWIHLRMSSKTHKAALTKGQRTLDCFFSSKGSVGDGSSNHPVATGVTKKSTKRNRTEDSPEENHEQKLTNVKKRPNNNGGFDDPIELNDTLPAPASLGSTATSKSSSLSSANSDQIISVDHLTVTPQKLPLRTRDGSKSPLKIVEKLPRLNIIDDPAPKPPQPRYIEVPKHKARALQRRETIETLSVTKKSSPPKFAATSVKMMYGKMDKDTISGTDNSKRENKKLSKADDQLLSDNGKDNDCVDTDKSDLARIYSEGGAHSTVATNQKKRNSPSKLKGVTRIVFDRPKTKVGIPLAQMERLTMNKSDLFSEDEQDENADRISPIVEHTSPTASQSVIVSPGKALRAAGSLVNKSPLRLQNATAPTAPNSERPPSDKTLHNKIEDDSCDSDDLFDNLTSPVKKTVEISNKVSVPDMKHVKPRRDVQTLIIERFVKNFESKPNAHLIVGRVVGLDADRKQKNIQKDHVLNLDTKEQMNKENDAGVCSNDLAYVILGGSWLSETFEPNSEVSVFGWFRGPVCRIDSASGGLVVSRPDVLLPATTVASSFFCPRKALLQQKFRKLEGLNANMLVGTIAHEVFQKAVIEKLQRSEIVAVTDEILSRSSILHDICLLGTAPHEIKAHVLQMVPHILSFIRGNCPGGRKDFRLREVVDIEENLWCPRLGVKGKVDMTVELEMASGASTVGQAPLELKTGKPTFSREHSAQVLLYTLMMNEKIGAEQKSLLPDNAKGTRDTQQGTSCGVGVLTYIQRGADSALVKADKESLQGLMQHRNHLAEAWWTMQNPEVEENNIRLGPKAVGPFKEEERFCETCNANLACSLYARMGKDLPEGSVRAAVATKVLGHLREEDLAYAWHWLMLLDIEANEHARQNPQAFWKYSVNGTYLRIHGNLVIHEGLQQMREIVERRVSNGTCAAELKVANSTMIPKDSHATVGLNQDGDQHKGQDAKKVIAPSNYLRLEGPPDKAIHLAPGSYIALSEQDITFRRAANKLGFIHSVEGNSIYLDLDLDPSESKTLLDPNKKYVVDLVNSSSAFGAAYANLVRLLDPDQSSLRKAIIEKTEPTFEPVHPRADIENCMDILTELNENQVRAVIKLLTARDYLLLQGMPGTGKTTVIVATIRVLMRLGQRVLVTSNTHNALDNILEKLMKHNVDFVRMGKTSHPAVRQKTNEVQLAGATSVAQVKEFYKRQRVFGSTCLGIAHSVFEKERFDVCIVDEASQVLQPVCLGPLMLAKKFLLVGDPKQLPPVIHSKEARRLGFEECLFKRLQRDDGSNLVVLNRQYRMNSEIMELCNQLVYGGELSCGNDEIAGKTLRFADQTDCVASVGDTPLNVWEQRCLSTKISESVVFLDATGVSEQENSGGNAGLSNPVESRLLRRIVNLLMDKGVPAATIGAIAPFRRQVLQLKSDLPVGVEVSTVDRYQGKEKDVILFSCVRTQPSANMEQEIMNDVRRLNVAVSRAKYKFIVVGARKAVMMYPSWQKLLQKLRPEQFVRVQDEN